MPQQRSDDPRRGGKVSIEVREAWNTDPIETIFSNNLDNEIEASGNTPSNEIGIPNGKLRTAGSAEINLSQSFNKIGIDLITVNSMEDSIKMNPSAEINLGEVAESKKIKDHEIGLQQSYARTDEHKDNCKGGLSLQLEERCEIDDESDNYWDAEEEIDDENKGFPPQN